jgi:catechol 2,3-dioxygenase-like lactoylglutathione lyase family enzyme
MIAATHALIYAEDAEETRAFFRDVLGWENVDAGDGWLIFALPPSELGVHPAEPNESGRHELFLMCHDVEKTREELETKGVEFTSPIEDQGFGLITSMKIPGAGELKLYQPKHASPLEEFDTRPASDRD